MLLGISVPVISNFVNKIAKLEAMYALYTQFICYCSAARETMGSHIEAGEDKATLKEKLPQALCRLSEWKMILEI